MILNKKTCLIAGGNTGVGPCFLDLKSIRMAILVPKNAVYLEAELATKETLLAALQADTLEVSRNRVYPIKNLVGITDNTEEPTLETLGYGGIAVVRDGKYNLTFRFTEGGFCLSKSLRKFNSANISVILIDDAGQLLGWRDGSGLKGFPLELFYALPPRMNDGAGAVASYQFQIVFDSSYLADNLGFIEGGSISFWQSLNGLQDVVLIAAAGNAEPILKISTAIGCSGENLLTDFATELQEETLWIATNKATGADITVTSVSIVGGVATVTLDATDPDYPAGVGSLGVKLTTPVLLAAAGVEGYESNELLVATS